MKLSTFVAIAAVIGGSFLIPVPANASVYVNLDKNTLTGANDGDCRYYITKNSITKKSSNMTDACWPYKGSPQGASFTDPLWGGSRAAGEDMWNQL